MKTNKTLDLTLLIVRIFLGSIIAAHGAQKLLGWFGGYGFEGTMGFFTDTVGLPYLIALLVILAESVGNGSARLWLSHEIHLCGADFHHGGSNRYITWPTRILYELVRGSRR
jgi:hypothetical protein